MRFNTSVVISQVDIGRSYLIIKGGQNYFMLKQDKLLDRLNQTIERVFLLRPADSYLTFLNFVSVLSYLLQVITNYIYGCN